MLQCRRKYLKTQNVDVELRERIKNHFTCIHIKLQYDNCYNNLISFMMNGARPKSKKIKLVINFVFAVTEIKNN